MRKNYNDVSKVERREKLRERRRHINFYFGRKRVVGGRNNQEMAYKSKQILWKLLEGRFV